MEKQEAGVRAMLQMKEVQKNYKTFQLDCTLSVKPGQITGLIGQNGAGKSTAFKAILNLISIESGEITIFGKPHTEIGQKEREDIGVVLAETGFSEYLSVADIAAIMQGMYRRFDKAEFLRKCEYFKLPLNKKVKEFSTGMKAKLKLLTATSYGAKFLILDEPTLGLDVLARDEMLAMLQEYMGADEQRSVLISSHISTDIEKFCDDIYMINEGKIILHEETDVLLDSYGILKVEEQNYGKLEKSYILCGRKESYGYELLTNERQFYMENYPELVVEKANVDSVITMLVKGEKR